MTNEQKRKQITTLFGAYSKRLEKLYDDFIMQLSRLAIKTHVSVKDMLNEDPLFRFDKFPELRQEYNRIFSDYVQNEMLCYKAGITDGVALAFSHDSGVLTGFSVLSDKAISRARKTAAETFLRTRLNTKQGLNLSHLVWNYASQAKSEFEVAISNVIADGLKKGTSAADLARQVRQYLNNPDMMYRRYHRTVVDAQGNKKDIVRWRRRIIDEQGKVRFVEEPLEKVGMGHYRSARKNSERLMRTEINSSYHHANFERWQNEPFVIGIVIDLSPQHPVPDMCDDLQGRYPKDFLFYGWHPQCLCMSNPITLQGDEKKEFYRRLAAGEDMSDYVSPHAVTDIPDSAKAWIKANRKQFVSAGERGKLGYVWRDNQKYLRPHFSKEEQEKMGIAAQSKKRVKTEAEKQAIQQRWDERKRQNELTLKMANNVLAVAKNKDYMDVAQYTYKLQEAISSYNLVEARTLAKDTAKQIAAVNRKVKEFEAVIPNVSQHLRALSVSDIQGTYDSVIGKLAKIEGKFPGNLLKQIEKLQWEANDYLGANMGGVQQKYPLTWHISQEGYLNLASKKQLELTWNGLKDTLSELKLFKTKSPVFAQAVMDAEQAVLEGNLTKMQDSLKLASDTRVRLEKEAANRARRKSNSAGLWENKVEPFNAAEKAKMMEYEKKLLDAFTDADIDALKRISEEYSDYMLDLSKKYYGKQVSAMTEAEKIEAEARIQKYLAHPRTNPHFTFGSDIGGVYDSKEYNRITLAKELKNVSKDELSIVTRFTNGSTFSNSYVFRETSEYWKQIWEGKMMSCTSSEAKLMKTIIDDYQYAVNGVLDKMQRYNGIVFRGLKEGGADELIKIFKEAWDSGKKVWENAAPASSSTHFRVAMSFDRDLIIAIHNRTGASIRAISEYRSEEEVMLLGRKKYRLLRKPFYKEGRYWVELEEIV